jgi:hypothetical protein
MRHPALEIEHLVDELAGAAEELETATLRRSQAEVRYKLQMASTRVGHKLLSKASDKHAEDLALIDCENEFQAFTIAQAEESAIRDRVRILQARLDGCRSLSVAIRNNG